MSLKRENTENIVYEGIVSLIMNGKIQPGSRLVEQQIADELHVSRTPVRNAMRTLASEGLIEEAGHGGYSLFSLSRKDVRELYRVKSILEPQIAVEAAKNAPLISFQRSLVSQTSLIIAQYESGNRSHCSYDEHMQLIDAIEARNGDLAVSLMMHHMDHIDSKLNLDEESASDDLHAVFSHLLQTKGKPTRPSAKL